MDRKKSSIIPWALVLVMGAYIGIDKLSASPSQRTSAPTPRATQRVYITPKPADPIGQMVWIPRTGKKYHKKSSCSNMKDPSYVALDIAISLGYEKCSKCWK